MSSRRRCFICCHFMIRVICLLRSSSSALHKTDVKTASTRRLRLRFLRQIIFFVRTLLIQLASCSVWLGWSASNSLGLTVAPICPCCCDCCDCVTSGGIFRFTLAYYMYIYRYTAYVCFSKLLESQHVYWFYAFDKDYLYVLRSRLFSDTKIFLDIIL